MAEFHTVARKADIPDGTARAMRVANKTIAVFHHGGRFYAIDDMCPHMGAPLSEGIVEGEAVACAWHGWRFRLTDGCWLNSPKLKIGSYVVRVVGDEVQVEV